MTVMAIPRVLRDTLGDEAADAFVGVIREIDFDARQDAIAIVEERFERRLAEEGGKLRVEIEKLRTEIKVEMAQLRAEIKVDMSAFKAEIIKWMFLFWVGQMVTMVAMFKFFAK
jgi:hypothetical protein